jgi:hypothetical protein
MTASALRSPGPVAPDAVANANWTTQRRSEGHNRVVHNCEHYLRMRSGPRAAPYFSTGTSSWTGLEHSESARAAQGVTSSFKEAPMAGPPIVAGIWNWPAPLAEEQPSGRPTYAGYKVVANAIYYPRGPGGASTTGGPCT